MGRVAPKIVLSAQEERILRSFVRAHKTSQQVSCRAQMILGAAKGLENVAIASRLCVDAQRVGRWRLRWAKTRYRLEESEREGGSGKDLKTMVKEILSDDARSGAPSTFSAEQFTQIIALACEDPQESGYPVSHWTPKEIAAEAKRRKIVDTISVRHVGRFLKGGRYPTAQNAVLDDLQG